MKKEGIKVVYDALLRIEACYFDGMAKPFPNHFHEYYVIGFVEEGECCLFCRGKNYAIGRGSIVLFNPGDNHACVQTDKGVLSYRAFHISKEVMRDWAKEVIGKRELPGFSENIIFDNKITDCFRLLHEMMMNGDASREKRKSLFSLLSVLILNYSQPVEEDVSAYRDKIERACGLMRQYFAERIYLDEICHQVQLSSSTLLRAFVKLKGVTPYRYLEAIRIDEAKRLLKNGASLSDAAIRTGFSDQSHFTHSFTRFIGFTPGVYRKAFFGKRKNGA